MISASDVEKIMNEADTNKDGTISLQELAAALHLAASETSDEAKEVINAVDSIIATLSNQIEKDTLVDQEVPDGEGDGEC